MLFNRTFFRNAVSFVAILAFGFLVLFGAEYLRMQFFSQDDRVEVYSDCLTDTGEPCY